MRCKTCDYPLWNLPARKCPECGSHFKPSEFRFVPNAVRYLCPHCQQQYFGTTEHGHLIPRTFNCVQCAQRIDMDEMLLLPAEGVDEARTAADVMPWLERQHLGFLKGWLRTLYMSMLTPASLMKAVPANAGVGDSTLFLLLTQGVYMLCGIGVPLAGIGVTMLMSGQRKGGQLIVGGGIATIGGAVGMLVVAWLWALLTHGLLRISGGCAAGVGRTAQAMHYSSAGMLLIAVPCVGSYCGGYVIWIWWTVSAIMMVMQSQRVSGLRATLCVGAAPALAIAALIAIITVAAIMSSQARSTALQQGVLPPGSYAAVPEALAVGSGILSYAQSHNGRGPMHGIELLADGRLTAGDIAIMQVGHDEASMNLPAANLTVDAFQRLPTNRRNIAAQSVAQSVPANVIAHRLGDVVFTHHGMDLSDPAQYAGLWVAVICSDPEQPALGPGATAVSLTPVAAMADGTTTTLPLGVNSALPVQNALRRAHGLPPLPDLSTILNGSPAVDDQAGAASRPSS